ncbi:MAG: HIT family protein [Reyranellaceae bacterium]
MHPTDSNCIFCKIVAGQIPCFKLYEDAETIAFMDINPVNDGHALAVAKGHYADIHDIPSDVLGKVAATARRIAQAQSKALQPSGINLLQANGPGAGQTVFHLHFHVLPRTAQDGELKVNWGHNPGDMAHIKSVYEKLLAAM